MYVTETCTNYKIRQHGSAVYVGMVVHGCLYAIIQTEGSTTPER